MGENLFGKSRSYISVVAGTKFEPTTFYFVNKHSNRLAKWLSARLRTKWLWVRVPLLSPKLQISHLFQARSSLMFRQLKSVDSLQKSTCVT